MNANFVNIKVDREERPDLDQIYQTAHALLDAALRRLAAHDVPHAARASRSSAARISRRRAATGLPGFLDLLPRIAAAYREQRRRDRGAERAPQGRTRTRSSPARAPARRAAGRRAPAAALAALEGALRSRAGRLRRGAEVSARDRSRVLPARARCAPATRRRSTIVDVTLSRMADGGIHDQLGGGFCRYSVDADWTIPHFEKMLYDNGPLLGAVCRPRARDGRIALRRRRARHRRLDEGARCARRTARSSRASTPTARTRRASSTSGRATRCARCWQPTTTRVAAPHWGLDRPPNFEGHAWNLRVARPLADVAAALGVAAARREGAACARRRRRCFAARAMRVRPGTRRQDPDLVERARDRRARPRARALDVPSFADLAFAAADALRRDRVARRPSARDAQGRPRAPQRLSRRLRVPALGAARAHADALPPRRFQLGAARSPTCCSRSSRIASAADSCSRATITSG